MVSRVCLVNLAEEGESQPRKHKGMGKNQFVQPDEVKLAGLERISKVEGNIPRLW